ncbi:MAG: M56 family metallopeptidase [Bacteroidota bacterium]|nr:M56 family metallopeptidase [Bacteroidota bacterium]
MNLSALQHSAFLQSLGWAIANSLWQTGALWVVYHIVNGIHKNTSARFKNNLSTILLFSSFVWFCISLFNKYSILGTLKILEKHQHSDTRLVNTANQAWQGILIKFYFVLPYLSIAYLLLLLLLAARLIKSYHFTYFIKNNGLQKPDVEWKLFTEKVARHMGIAKKVTLWISQHIDVPATIGFLKPVILIPLSSVNQLTEDQMEAIILHELSHIKRNDYLLNMFISIIETLLFFNPFVVLLTKIIKRERENCCDDIVIQYQYDRHSYASALLSLEQSRNINMHLALTATTGKKQLLHRIKRIMEIKSNTNFNYGQKLAVLILITGIFCSIAWLSASNNEKKNIHSQKIIANNLSINKINKAERKESYSELKNNRVVKANENIKIKREIKAENITTYQPDDKKQNDNEDFSTEEIKKDFVENNLEKNNFSQYKSFNNIPVPDPSLFFTNENAFLPAAKYLQINREIWQKMKDVINAQKVRWELGKKHFAVDFNLDKLQDEIKRSLNNVQWDIPEKRISKTTSGKKANSTVEIKNNGFEELNAEHEQKILKSMQRNLSSANSRSYSMADSIIHREIILLNRHLSRTSEINSNLFRIAPEEKKVRIQRPQGFTYNISTETNSDKIIIPDAPNTKSENNFTIAFRQGVIVISGNRKLILCDNNKTIIQAKTKKITATDPNETLMKIHISDL